MPIESIKRLRDLATGITLVIGEITDINIKIKLEEKLRELDDIARIIDDENKKLKASLDDIEVKMTQGMEDLKQVRIGLE